MICKKCGANIADTSKFCGYCGTPVQDVPASTEVLTQNPQPNIQQNVPNPNLQNNTILNTNPVETPLVNNLMEAIEQPQNPVNLQTNSTLNSNPVEAVVNPTNTNNLMNAVDQTVQSNPVNLQNNMALNTNESIAANQVSPQNDLMPNPNIGNNNTLSDVQLSPMPDMTKTEVIQPLNQSQINEISPKKKKKNMLWIIILIAVLAVGAVVGTLVVLNSNNKQDKPVVALQKSLGNMKNKIENSATINANIQIESATNDTFNLSANLKYAKISNGYNIAFTLNKSLLSDEINIYSLANKENISLYVKSSVIDLFGLTESEEDMWLNLNLPLDEMEINLDDESEINIFDIIDENHVSLIDTTNGVRHYELKLDKQLIDNNKDKLTDEQYDSLISIFDLNDSYPIDFYINSSNEIEKVSIEISNFGEDEDISKVVLSIEFSDLNSTTVTIPQDALNSVLNIEDYMNTYNIQDETIIDENRSLDQNDVTQVNIETEYLY